VALLSSATPAFAEFPFAPQGNDPNDYTDLYVTDEEPNDVGTDATPASPPPDPAPPDNGGGEYWKYSASPEPMAQNEVNDNRPTELDGVRGASLFDFDESLDWAWQVSSGRPDVTIATLDSGVKWNELSAMNDLRFKTRINAGEVPVPLTDRANALVSGEDCDSYADAYDANSDGVFNLRDYACDSRVNVTDSRRVGPNGVLTPQDVLIAFSSGSFPGAITGGEDDDGNGYVDDMVGWDFLDDDNDPFDDVLYGHGTGEAEGSSGEADNGSTLGSCPNCMVIHMRVGDSFIADINRFAQAVVYAVDNGVLVVQSALGTLNNSSFARDAVDYAYDHGVTTVVSAADEAAQHNNQPYLPKTILVNSVTRRNLDDGAPEGDQSYLAFNGCTNFNAKIALAIPSTSCSSDAVGVGSGLAGIVVSTALNAYEQGALDPHPTCVRAVDVDGTPGLDPCVITPNEVRQLMASGTIGGQAMPDDVNFTSPAGGPEPSCTPALAGCTHPYGAPGTANGAVQSAVDANRAPLPGPITALRSYPARRGHDQFYGYGRVNINRSVRALLAEPDPGATFESQVPPEAELRSPTWNQQLDPGQATIDVTGQVWARGSAYSCQVLAAPGHYPNNDLAPEGDFEPVDAGGGACNGIERFGAADGKLAEIDVAALEARFPPATNFTGPEPIPSPTNGNGRPNSESRGFVVKVVVTRPGAGATPTMTGEDQRAAYLLRDQDMLVDFPRAVGLGGATSRYGIPTGDVESSPAFADLDGDNRSELIFASSDGFVHAMRPNGTELPDWPVRGDVPGFVAGHAATRAFQSGQVSLNLGGAMLSSVAVGDANRDGVPEVYVADLEGKLYGWSAEGDRILTEETNIAYSGKPLNPFENVRYEPGQSEFRRTQHGFIASPVLADLDRNDGGRLEIVAAAMDRHVYVWNAEDSNPTVPGGTSQVSGFPMLVVDPAKVASVASTTHAITFKPDAGSFQQGAIIDTPAVGDLDDDDMTGENEQPEIVVGTNEEYDEPLNADNVTTATFPPIGATGLIRPGNSRLYALPATGDDDDDPLLDGSDVRPGWPFAVGIVTTGLLPVVGEGITSNPVIGPVSCPLADPGADTGPNIGTVANNGPAYILNASATSCYNEGPSTRPNALESDFSASGQRVDTPVLPAVGHTAFGALDPSGELSFLTPAAGLTRALDLALPEYQPSGQDFLAVWNTSTPDFRLGFPATVNDLQFLTGPSVADLDGEEGEEIVEGTASKDLVALNGAGLPVDAARWPKATTDWTVTTPLVGSFGTRDTDAAARKVVVAATRSGYVSAYATSAPACSPSSSPRFHHDNANSGDYSRDAVLPGRPFDATVAGSTLAFTAPGDDLLCGTGAVYDAVTSNQPIDESNFAAAKPLAGEPAPAQAGMRQSYEIPAGAQRYIAIRAVDEQNNVGRPAVVDLGTGASPPGGGGAGGDDGQPPGGGVCSNAIAGTAADDKLKGTDGSDRLRGNGGDDRLNGAGGDDCLSGQSGADRLSGGAGADAIKGGRGKDRLRGGPGADTIRATRGARDRVNCGRGRDTVFLNRDRDRARNCELVRSP
jgi:hypothetical protein